MKGVTHQKVIKNFPNSFVFQTALIQTQHYSLCHPGLFVDRWAGMMRSSRWAGVSHCPIGQRQISWSEFLTVKKGASVTCLRLWGMSGDDCVYNRIDPCSIRCPRDQIRIDYRQTPNRFCTSYAQDIRYWTE